LKKDDFFQMWSAIFFRLDFRLYQAAVLGELLKIRVARFFLLHDKKTGKIYQMNAKCTKLSFCPNLDFLFENVPSGNPGKDTLQKFVTVNFTVKKLA
jgi:hypothetical protein